MKRSLITFFVLVAALSLSAMGQEEPPNQEGPPVRGPNDLVELEAFIDGLMTAHLEAYESAGATVSVVKSGELLFSRGYGYADVETKKPVEPDKTLFRVGSISKLFVWTAVMQLVEQGRLDLNADVNTYLKGVQVPPAYGEPVTMAHLMTHSPGFEDRFIGLFGRDADSLAPLGEILERELPERVRPPGTFSSYSNHGTGLAMYIVECITGTGWEEYLAKNILDPLEMDHTTFSQPIPEALADDMSKGYSLDGGNFKEEGFEYVPLAPVGACASTADDMAKFMIAHLQLGRYGETTILNETTAKRMQSELFRHADTVSPMAHGFIEIGVNGERLVGHGGDTLWFHSMLLLLPEHDLGIFVSHNTESGNEAATKLVEQFVDRYYPSPDSTEPTAPADFSDRAVRFVGSYRPNRYPHTTIGKLAAVMAVEVKDTKDGALSIQGKRIVEIAPLTFKQEDGDRKVVFKEDENGAITHMFLSDLPIMAFEKLSVLERPLSQAVILGGATIFFLAAFVLWPLAAIVRNHYRTYLPVEARLPTGSKLVAWIASALFLVFLVTFALMMMDPEEIVFGIPTGLSASLWLPLIASVFVVGSLIYTIVIWKDRRGRTVGRLFYTLLTASFVVFLVQLNHWNVLGFRF
jgi:CubicO group peptidase (beta-lactamase class C family)